MPNTSEKATFYIRPGHQVILDEIKLKLRKQGIKTDKSQLVQQAIDLLAEQDLTLISSRLGAGREG